MNERAISINLEFDIKTLYPDFVFTEKNRFYFSFGLVFLLLISNYFRMPSFAG